MKQDRETKNKLLQSARAEFMEKGYMNASLRNICKNAGVTTGALYFFFESKADLYEALTKDVVEGILYIMRSHFQVEREMAAKGRITEPVLEEGAGEFESDIATSKMLIHQMYLRREDVLLVLTKSQGSRLEHVEELFIEESESHFRIMAKQMEKLFPGVVIDDAFIHWLAHAMIDAFIYMIIHIENEEKALNFIVQYTTYMQCGWYGLFQDKNQ